MDNRKSRLGVALAALAFYAVFIYRTSFVLGGTRTFVLFEDAMISMRYARNLAEGHGLVWNPGEAHIEGFTNLLWVLWMSVAHLLHLSEAKISLFIMLTGVGILFANAWVVAKIARRLSDAKWLPLAVLAATLFDYPLVFWTLRGMEVGALTLLVDVLLYLVLENEVKFTMRRTVLMSAVTAAALLLRSDSVVPIALIGLYGLYTAEKRVLFAVTMAAGAGGAVGAQTAFRIAYFHDRLPNTAYLKLIGIPLSARLKRGVFVALEMLAMHLAVPLAVIAARLGKPEKTFYQDPPTRRRALLGALFAAQIAYATYVGGDAWEWMLYANRYSCVGMPALILLVALCLDDLLRADEAARERAARKFAGALVAMGLVLVLLNVYGKLRPEQGVARTIYFSKTPFAFGGAYVGLGAAFFMKDLREGVRDGLGWLRVRFGSRATLTTAALVVMGLVWFPSHAVALGRWATQNAAQYIDEARYTRLGFLLRATTPDDHRIAVAAAGATPYFSRRPTEDLLGKNDAHIAHLPPKGVFSPGHDKWDYAWSLGERKTQLIVEPVDVSASEQAYIDELGFEKLPNDMLLRRGAPGVKPELVGAKVDTVAELEAVLEKVDFKAPEPARGVDLGVCFVLALVGLGLVVGLSRDADDLSALDEAAPPPTPGPAPTSGHDHIKTLDGMRGIAVLLVLAFHFSWEFPEVGTVATHVKRVLWTGWIGVDLFFVLSGFLITRGLVAPSDKPLLTRMKMFWMRRVLRIFPLYYAFIIVGSVIGLALGHWIPGPAYWLYMQNYVLAFDPEELRWTAHFWSLAIEEQFYFVWPVVALVTPRKRLVPLTLTLIAACVVLRAGITLKAHFWDPLTIVKFVYRATLTRADGLLLGALVATLQRESSHTISHLWRRLRFPLFALTGVGIVGLYVVAKGLNGYDRRVVVAGYFLLALFFASAVSLCADGQIGPRMRAFLSSRVLVSCGKVSYGMYIFHWPVLILAIPTLKRVQVGLSEGGQLGVNTAFLLGAVGLVWGAAQLSFTYFETPFLKLKGRFLG